MCDSERETSIAWPYIYIMIFHIQNFSKSFLLRLPTDSFNWMVLLFAMVHLSNYQVAKYRSERCFCMEGDVRFDILE